MLIATRAIVATGAYGPKGYDTDMEIMLAQKLPTEITWSGSCVIKLEKVLTSLRYTLITAGVTTNNRGRHFL